MKLIKRTYQPVFPSLFDDFFTRDGFGPEIGWPALKTGPAVNIVERDDAFAIEVAAPGLAKEDFKIEVENDLLTISFEKKAEKEEKGRYTKREFSYTSFSRSFTLPEGVVDADAIDARYENGVLHLNLPKREEVKPKPKRTIAIG